MESDTSRITLSGQSESENEELNYSTPRLRNKATIRRKNEVESLIPKTDVQKRKQISNGFLKIDRIYEKSLKEANRIQTLIAASSGRSNLSDNFNKNLTETQNSNENASNNKLTSQKNSTPTQITKNQSRATTIFESIDENLLSTAWLQIAQIVILAGMYVVDIFLDLYFCFVDVRIQYEKFITVEYAEEFNKTHPRRKYSPENIEHIRQSEDCGTRIRDPSGSGKWLDYPDCGDIFTIGIFPNKSNCYSAIFWASLSVIIAAYLMYSIASLYIIFGTKSKNFEEFRHKIKGAPAVYEKDGNGKAVKINQDGEPVEPLREAIKPMPKHQARFALLTVFGVGPNYFIYEDLKTEWKLLDPEGTHDWKWKMKQKTLVWLDAYIHTRTFVIKFNFGLKRALLEFKI